MGGRLSCIVDRRRDVLGPVAALGDWPPHGALHLYGVAQGAEETLGPRPGLRSLARLFLAQHFETGGKNGTRPKFVAASRS